MMGVIGYTAEGCACASLVFNIISIALPYWLFYQESITSAKNSFGLWTTCETAGSEKSCSSYLIVPVYLTAVRALEIMRLLLVTGAGIFGALKLFSMKENQVFPLLAGGIAILAGAFMIIGAIVFAVKTPYLSGTGATLHAGFALAIVAGVIAFVAGGLFFGSKSNKLQPSRGAVH